MGSIPGPVLALGAAAAVYFAAVASRPEPQPAAPDNTGRVLAGATIGGLVGSVGGHALLIGANPVVAGSPVGLALTAGAGAAGAAVGAAVADGSVPIPSFMSGWF